MGSSVRCSGACNKNPTSPHLLIYDMPFVAFVSMGHRVSGVALYFVILMAVGFSSWAVLGGKDAGANSTCISYLYNSWFGKAFLILSAVALFFHTINGVKYIVVDVFSGKCLEKNWGLTVAILVVLLTGIFGAGLAFYMLGGKI